MRTYLWTAVTVDVSITFDIPCSNQVLQKASITRTRHVLDRNFHRAEFIEFAILDVLATGLWSQSGTSYATYVTGRGMENFANRKSDIGDGGADIGRKEK